MEFKAGEIAEALEGVVVGDESVKVSNVEGIEVAKKGDLAFLSNSKYERYIYTTNASVVIVNKSFVPKGNYSTTLIKVENAYEAVATLLQMYEEYKPKKIGIEQPSFVHDSVKLGEEVYVGAFAYIGANVTIGKRVKIYPHVYIGDNVKIADDTQLFSGVKVYANTIIGRKCIIHSGAVLGADGFGFAPQKNGSYKKIPQVGSVVLEDGVEIGANTCVDRAMLGKTVLKEGVKLDNLIQIAHNCIIGKDTVIAAQSGIAGSTIVGENCVFGGQVGVTGHIKVADKVQVQAQSGVTAGTKEGEILMGTPAIDYKNYYRSYAIFKKQNSLQKDIAEIKRILKQYALDKEENTQKV